LNEEKPRDKRKRIILAGLMILVFVLAGMGILFLYEKSSDPVIVEIIDNSSSKGILYKIIHLNNGRIDYVFNYTENIGTHTSDFP